MTIGQLARRTGVPIKTLREYESLGLIYTRGRSEGNYRLFGDEALWCVQVIQNLRSLGLTVKEIREIASIYLKRPGEPIGPHVQGKLDQALDRIERRMTELQALRQQILDFKAEHAAILAGQNDEVTYLSDPRRRDKLPNPS